MKTLYKVMFINVECPNQRHFTGFTSKHKAEYEVKRTNSSKSKWTAINLGKGA